MITETLQWICAILGALMVGISKAGITGLSILSVALFTHVFPSSKQASGLMLPLLIFGDFVAVLSYRTHTQWRYLWKLMPWTAAGVVLGYFALGHISDQHRADHDRRDHRLPVRAGLLAPLPHRANGGIPKAGIGRSPRRSESSPASSP